MDRIHPLPSARRRLVAVALPLLLLATLALPAQAQSNVAVIDVQRILTESARGKEAIAELEQLSKERADALLAKKGQLEELQNRYAQTRLSLTEDKLAEMQQQIEDLTIELRREQDDARRAVEERQKVAFAQVEEQVLPIINELGRERGFTLIFNKFQSGLVYADDAVDVTDEVIRRFDARSQAAP